MIPSASGMLSLYMQCHYDLMNCIHAEGEHSIGDLTMGKSQNNVLQLHARNYKVHTQCTKNSLDDICRRRTFPS